MKCFGQGPDLMIDAFRENRLYSRRAGLLAKTHLWIQRATGMPGHQGKKMDFHSPAYQELCGACFGYCQWKEGWVSLVMCKEIHRWLFLEGDSWMELDGTALVEWSLGNPSFCLLLPFDPKLKHFVLVQGTVSWCWPEISGSSEEAHSCFTGL